MILDPLFGGPDQVLRGRDHGCVVITHRVDPRPHMGRYWYGSWTKGTYVPRPTKGLKRAQKGCSKWVPKMVHFGPPKSPFLDLFSTTFGGQIHCENMLK